MIGEDAGGAVRVLHGVWTGDALAVWAESVPSAPPPDETAASAPPPAERAHGRARPHPFALEAHELRALLADAGIRTHARNRPDTGTEAGAVTHGTLDLSLPGDTFAPFSSTRAPGTAPAAFHPWRVPALRLDAASAEALLSAPASDVPDTASGPSLAHLRAVRDFAELLVTSGCVLPDLVGDPARARWRPAPLDWAEEHLAALTGALPPSARAHLPGEPPDAVARACVLAPLELLTDAAARRLARPRRAHRAGTGPASQDRTGPEQTSDDGAAPGQRLAAAPNGDP
ncbi:ATP-dependent helicase, partial [Nocardiopsis dassonvillei]|nr:ATP-dependent helicase [Nocardiopsis dassonvillei]